MVANSIGGDREYSHQAQYQVSPTFSIIAVVLKENMIQPVPEPAALIPLARLRFVKALGQDRNAWNVDESHPETHQNTLREEKLPYSTRKRC